MSSFNRPLDKYEMKETEGLRKILTKTKIGQTVTLLHLRVALRLVLCLRLSVFSHSLLEILLTGGINVQILLHAFEDSKMVFQLCEASLVPGTLLKKGSVLEGLAHKMLDCYRAK